MYCLRWINFLAVNVKPEQSRLVFLDENAEGRDRLAMFDGQQEEPDEVEERMFVGRTAKDGRVALGVSLQSVRSLDVFTKTDVLKSRLKKKDKFWSRLWFTLEKQEFLIYEDGLLLKDMSADLSQSNSINNNNSTNGLCYKKVEKNINRLKIRSRIESLWKTFRAKTYFYLLTCDSFVMSITFNNNIIKTIIIIQFNFFKFFLTWRTVPVTKRSISFGNPLLVWNSTNMWPQPIKRNEIG